MNQDELKNGWSRVQEMFSHFCHSERLAQEAKLGFSKDGRGAIFLYMAHRDSVCTYASRDWIEESIDENLDHGVFKQALLSAINLYKPDTQAIILVSFDDIFLSETISYQWFEIDILQSQS
jgi:hypothetical protein